MTRNIDLENYDCKIPMPDPSNLEMSRKNSCVFDDMVTESNQSIAESYCTRDRHNNVSCIYIYICQIYHSIRTNTISSEVHDRLIDTVVSFIYL